MAIATVAPAHRGVLGSRDVPFWNKALVERVSPRDIDAELRALIAARSLLAPGVMQQAATRTLFVRAKYTTIEESVDAIEACVPWQHRSSLVRVAITEALANAIVHGALRISSRLRDDGEFEAWLSLIEDAERRAPDEHVQVTVCDSRIVFFDGGPGFDWRSSPVRPGRGLSILHAAFSSVRWNDTGNTLTVVFR